MSSDNHMTDICEAVVNAARSDPMFQERGMEAKLWGHVFSTTNPHMFIEPWDMYRKLPECVYDFIAMWGGMLEADAATQIQAENTLPTPQPLPTDIFGLILQGRDVAPALFKSDPTMEHRLFAYCLNATRPHSEAHGRTMHRSLSLVIQQFIEIWRPIYSMAEAADKQLPPGLVELPDGDIVADVKRLTASQIAHEEVTLTEKAAKLIESPKLSTTTPSGKKRR